MIRVTKSTISSLFHKRFQLADKIEAVQAELHQLLIDLKGVNQIIRWLQGAAAE